MNVSRESEEFLGNLRIYLISSGKNECEVDDIVGELEDHLAEAEKRGKSVEDVTGLSPKEYMNQISEEMPLDYKGIFKLISIVLLGGLSFVVMGDTLRDTMRYSVLELLGYPLIMAGFLFLTSVIFKYVSSRPVSKGKEMSLYVLLASVPIVSFVGMTFLDRVMDTPIVDLGGTARLFAFILTIAVFVGLSLYSKTWILIILPILVFVPEFFIQQSDVPEETKLILSSISLPVFVGGYFLLWLVAGKNKKEGRVF
ncbi:hypothetical protein LCM10_12440 [Rossellomorea aquimaris]|uniref:HAAS domain-containing protein n=1 Tax=Rossellomorea aquimaris TaxID=189382 RepID=UPI001CD569D9|nr:hypothetical protein [Rossellomorea aquimaris]MCA1055797.1 hypothetical protein [Rossellomorea aquimaris]